jgi:hypothetical protein
LQACVSLGQNARWLGRGLQTSWTINKPQHLPTRYFRM